MTIDATDFDSSNDISDYLDWALDTGVWNGREVSWMETSDFRDEAQARILNLLFENPDSPLSEELAAQLAWIGTSTPNQSLLARDIQELNFSKGDLILQAGLKKSLSKFWKKHKKEILIGAAVLATVTVVVVVSVSTAGAGAAAAGGAALGSAHKKDKKKRPQPDPVSQAVPPASLSLPLSDLTPKASQLIFGETGVLFNQQYTSYQNILLNRCDPIFLQPAHSLECTFPPTNHPLKLADQPVCLEMRPDMSKPWSPHQADWDVPQTQQHFPEVKESQNTAPSNNNISPHQQRPWIANFLDTVGREIIDNSDLLDPNVPLPSHQLSFRFSTLGKSDPRLLIMGNNGINTTKEEAVSHANHLAQFTKGYPVDWVYNNSHGGVVDVAEAIIFNLPGYSPNTAEEHLAAWTTFHENNKDRPYAKCLQFCHSQGTIHIRNALRKAPPEIRDRVIVYAFAPAVFISDNLCHRVWRYACKGDVVPYSEVAYAGFIGGLAGGFTGAMVEGERMMAINHEKLIWVEKHPDTKNPHDFQNPAFDIFKKRAIEDYLEKNGEYR